jgi:hypothetical protein
MTRLLMCGALVALLMAPAMPLVAAEEQEEGQEEITLAEAVTKGKPILTFRYRYENVEEDDRFDKPAHASTLRTTFGYRSLAWKGLSFLVEGENVTVIGNDLYRNAGSGSLSNGVTDRPTVADPALTEVNQAYLQWQNTDNKLQLGREEIIIGDQRFVGNVGWRQHHQSFDAFTFANSSLERVDFFYSYVSKANRITGAVADMSSNLFNVGFKLGKVGKLTLYSYLLDYTQTDSFGNSTSTWGAEFAGKYAVSDTTSVLYELEYAQQGDYADNPNSVDVPYYFLMAGGAFKPLTVKLGYEVLGGSETDGQFATPLATLHKFNGWADRFLRTPVDGLEDLYLQLLGKVGPVAWTVVYHSFGADTGGANYGDELDFNFGYMAPWKQGFGFKGAFYNADEFSVDISKIWLWTSFKI